MVSITTSEVPKCMVPMRRFEVGSTSGNTRNCAEKASWEMLSRICATAKVDSIAASGRYLASGRTTEMLMTSPSAAQITRTAGSATQNDSCIFTTNSHASMAPSPKKENCAKFTTFMTPKTREMPTAPRA